MCLFCLDAVDIRLLQVCFLTSSSFSVCVFVHVLVPDLRGTDDGLAGRVAASNHHLLGDENFLCRDLNPQVASGNHHAIALSQDLLKTDREIRGGDEEDSEFGIKKGG